MGLTFRARPPDQWTDRTVRCLGLPGFWGRPGVLKDLAFSKVQQVVRATTSAFLQLVGEGYDIKWFKGPGLLKSATTRVCAARSAVLQLVEGYGTKRFKGPGLLKSATARVCAATSAFRQLKVMTKSVTKYTRTLHIRVAYHFNLCC